MGKSWVFTEATEKNSPIGTCSFDITFMKDVLLNIHDMPLNDVRQRFSDV